MIHKQIRVALCAILALFVFLPFHTLAHQPRITESGVTQVPQPEISKAYYGVLKGGPDVYIIESSAPFNLYVNVLVPDTLGNKKDVSAVVLRDGIEIAVLLGQNFVWKEFYELFGADTYWMGPEYRARAEAGTYEIRVWSSNNDSKYALAVGEIEVFGAKDGFEALRMIPELKKNFFNVSPITFIASPLGWGLIVAMYLLAGIFGLGYRTILKRFAKGAVRSAHNNIGRGDRLLRLAIGMGLLLLAITTTWSPILIFFSGFAFFEAIFSWCGFYGAIGKNTCPTPAP